jgi:branched-chain amino acid transport system ATP-binding protein
VSILLQVTGVTCRFGQLTVLDGLHLDLPAGQRLAVIGPNGAGKTTLVNTICGLQRVAAGRIGYAGRTITHTGPARRARLGIARTFQTPALAGSLTALDNVILGGWHHPHPRPDGGRGRVLHAQRHLDKLGLAAHAATPASHLAHGQRRLLEIAVALAARPRLLLLDEPAAGLSDSDLPRLIDCLRQLPATVAVLLVEHHMDVVTAIADTVTVLHQGRVLATGTPDQIRTNPAVAEVYLGATPGQVR